MTGADLLFANGEAKGATFTYTAPLAGSTAPFVAQPTNLNLDSESRRQFLGGYGLVEWTATSRLRLSGGLRLNADHERRGEGAGKMHVRPSGSAGVTFALWEGGADHVRLFANYRDTFKPAAFDFSLAENEGLLEPETARSYEGGVKVRANGGRAIFEASAFRLNFHNLVTSTVVGGLPALLNAGVTKFQGLELAAELRPAPAVSARASYSFHDGRFVDFVQAFDGEPTQLGGKRFEMSARHLFSAGVVLSPQEGLFGSLVFKYSGDRYLNKRNTALAPSFATVDFGAGYRFGQWELRLDARNLGDRRDPVAESELGDAQYYRLPARRFDVSMGFRF
jgi:outer membrane receptor protein involved in Fe transport